MLFLASTPNMAPITDLILTWTHIGQALVGILTSSVPPTAH